MVRRLTKLSISLLPVLGFLALTAGCGGDSSVGVSLPPKPPPAGPAVTGKVELPNGKVGQLHTSVLERFAKLVVSTAVALTNPSNLQAAGGVTVVLNRMNSLGQIDPSGGSAQAVTHTDGTYLFNLPSGTSEDTCRFIMQVGVTRAFVTSTSVPNNIDYISETAVRLILGVVNQGVSLCTYTSQDIRNLTTAIQLAPGAPTGDSEEELNFNAFNLAKNDPTVQAVLNAPVATVTPTRTRTATLVPATATPTSPPPTLTATSTQTNTVPPTFTRTPLPTNTPTTGPSSTATPSRTRTSTAVSTATQTPTRTATATATNTATSTATATATNSTAPQTSTPTSTSTATPTSTSTATATATSTATLTATSVPPTNTPTRTLTATLPAATSTFTATATATATFTATNVPPTNTATQTSTATSPAATSTPTFTPTATPTATNVPTVAQPVVLPTAIAPNDTVIPVSDINAFPDSGTVLIGGELITYDGKQATASASIFTLLGLTATPQPGELLNAQRGVNGTTAQAHSADSVVALVPTGISVNVGSGLANPGATVVIPVTLANSGGQVQATSNDIKYDPTQITVVLNPDNSPACTINPAIGTGTAPNKSLLLSVLDGTGGQKILRVGVINFQNVNIIPDGALFTCTFQIAANATPGFVTLTNVPGAANQDGDDLPGVGGTNGAVTVTSPGPNGPIIDVGSTSGSAGTTVTIGVTLANGNGQVQATSNDITYDSSQVDVVLNLDNSPQCTINAAIGAGTAPNKSLLLSVLTGAGTQKTLRVGVINFQNVNLIPDGALFTCNFKIGASASGTIALTNVPGAANQDGDDLSGVTGSNGSITVTAGAPTPSLTHTLVPTQPPTPTATMVPTASGPAQLTGALGAADTTITVSDGSAFATSGTVLIGGELINYSGKSGNQLLNAQRGANGTTAQVHPAGSAVAAVPAGLSVNVGGALGSSGVPVPVPVVLVNGNGQVQATSNDIQYDSSLVDVILNADNSPQCTINAAIGTGTAPNKSLLLSVLTGAGSQKTLRVGVINFQNVNLIPDGLLFTCNFSVAAGAAGPIVLTNVPGAANPDGDDLPNVVGTNGTITIAAAPPAGPVIDVGSASGTAGATVPIGVTLSNSGGVVQATSNDITYDSSQVDVVLNLDNSPQCTINAAIGTGTAPNKSLLLSVLTGAGTQKTLRVGVINFQNVNLIPDGPLFSCNFKIGASASGTIALTNVPGAANQDGDDLSGVTGANGSITVQ